MSRERLQQQSTEVMKRSLPVLHQMLFRNGQMQQAFRSYDRIARRDSVRIRSSNTLQTRVTHRSWNRIFRIPEVHMMRKRLLLMGQSCATTYMA